jgi:hypothetical protein
MPIFDEKSTTRIRTERLVLDVLLATLLAVSARDALITPVHRKAAGFTNRSRLFPIGSNPKDLVLLI